MDNTEPDLCRFLECSLPVQGVLMRFCEEHDEAYKALRAKLRSFITTEGMKHRCSVGFVNDFSRVTVTFDFEPVPIKGVRVDA